MPAHVVVYVDYNFDDPKYPNRPGQGQGFFTHGFGSMYARKFKQTYPQWEVQCWKADRYTQKEQQAEYGQVQYRIFPAAKFPRAGFFSFALLRAVKNYTRENPGHIINISSFDHILFWSIALFVPGAKIVVQHHGECPARHRMQHSKGLRKILWGLWSLVEQKALKKCSLLYALDPGLLDWIPLPPAKIKVQGTGVDISLFPLKDKNESRKQLGFAPEDLYLMYMGRLTNSKRPDMLIDVFLRLRNKFPRLRLVLGGCQPSDPFYKAAVDAGALTHGVIPQEEMHLWLNAADAYSLPLLDTAHVFGGIGMLPVQALLCGTPVVGSTMKCLPAEELPSAGFVSQTADQLEEALTKIFSKQATFPNTRQVAMNYYDWNSISKKTGEDYLKLMQNRCH